MSGGTAGIAEADGGGMDKADGADVRGTDAPSGDGGGNPSAGLFITAPNVCCDRQKAWSPLVFCGMISAMS